MHRPSVNAVKPRVGWFRTTVSSKLYAVMPVMPQSSTKFMMSVVKISMMPVYRLKTKQQLLRVYCSISMLMSVTS